MTAWLRPVAPGRPFHHLDRTDVYRWWRPAVGLVALLVAAVAITVGFVLTLLVVVWSFTGEWLEFASTGQDVFTNDLANLLALVGSLAVLLPLVMVVTLVVNRRDIGTLASVEGRLRWRWLLLCLAPAVAYMVVVLAASYGLDALQPSSDGWGAWAGWDAFWPLALVIVVVVPFQAAAEEYAFRGWLLQAIGAWTAPIVRSAWPAILLSALPFVAGHAYTDWGLLDIGMFAVVTGWVTVRTGGLEAAIGLHVVNNTTGMLFSAAEGELSLDQGAVPLPEVATDVIGLLLWAAAIVWMFRHTGSRRPMKRLS